MPGARETVALALWVSLLLALSAATASDPRDSADSEPGDFPEELFGSNLAYRTSGERQLIQQPLGQPYDNRIQYLIESKRSISNIKRLITDLESNFGKRICIGGGMGSGCDRRDMMHIKNLHSFLEGAGGPGRRRRSPAP